MTSPNRHNTSLPTSDPAKAKCKQTLLRLLDALQELSQDDGTGDFVGKEKATLDDDDDVPSIDERQQVAGAETFNKFQKCIDNLDKELHIFANATRQLGGSDGILSSALALRECVARLLFLFRENAASLFPRKVHRQPKETTIINPAFNVHSKQSQGKASPLVNFNLDPEDFPEQIEQFAVGLSAFLSFLNDFPEFRDEAINASVLAFEGDLNYWSSCLRVYKNQFRSPAVQRYIQDLTGEMGEYIDNITFTLSVFVEVGVPAIRSAQRQEAANVLDLSTIATFFSAVTATTLQFSYTSVNTPLHNAVNAFWFASLVLSIAAAVNSLAGLGWRKAMYRSPRHKVPWWVQIWIKSSPLVFLVLSATCFSVGLLLFSYSSGQSRVTCVVTYVLTAFTSFGLIFVSAWFISERWTYNHHQGRKWLSHVLDDAYEQFMQSRAVVATCRVTVWSGARIKRAGLSISQVLSFYVVCHTGGHAEVLGDQDIRAGSLPWTHNPNNSRPMSPGRFNPNTYDPSTAMTMRRASNSHSEHSSTPEVASQISPALRRLQQAVRSIIIMQGGMSAFSKPPGNKSGTNNGDGGDDESTRKELQLDIARSARMGSLVPKLKQMEPVRDLVGHAALIKHLQFSPDGKLLATSSSDRTSLIFRVGDPEPHRVLAHPQGFVGQVAWSPDGRYLLTKLTRAIKIWTEDGVCKRTIERHRPVQSVIWVPDGTAFMSVEGSSVVKIDHTGKVLDTYHLEPVILHDIAVTPDGSRLVGVGPLQFSPTGLYPSKSRVEKRIMVYNMDTQKVENHTPVLNDAHGITITKNGLFALVSYEDKAPPQLWRIEMIKGRDDPTRLVARLTLRHTYMPKVPIDYAGPSYFGGKGDQLVLCAGQAGDIHIWHRISGSLIRHIRGQDLWSDLTCIAGNSHWEDPFMFGTGSHDGGVRIWSSSSGASITESQGERMFTPKQRDNEVDLRMHKEEEMPASDRASLPVALQAIKPISSMSSQDSGLQRLSSSPTVLTSPHASTSAEIPSKGRLSPLHSTNLLNIIIPAPDEDRVHQRTITFAPTP